MFYDQSVCNDIRHRQVVNLYWNRIICGQEGETKIVSLRCSITLT